MGLDVRQVVAALLTFSMFGMLGNMVKRDHFPEVELSKLPEARSFQYGGMKVTQQSQIANAIVVARSLGATLVIPDIRGSKAGDKRNFSEIYDPAAFVNSLHGVISVTKDQPPGVSAGKLAVIKVPYKVSKKHIRDRLKPLLRAKEVLRLSTYFRSSDDKRKPEETSYLDGVECLATFETLRLQPEAQEFVDSIIERLRTLSRKSKGQFIAVDLKLEKLEGRDCQGGDPMEGKRCYNPQEIGEFLRKIGFDRDTPIYLTQSRWHSGLNPLINEFPNTYTKESIITISKGSMYEDLVDYYICSQSDTFVPAISGLFYEYVAANRIALGKTRILVPGTVQTASAPASQFLSSYIIKKNHFAYSCLC
ncbi:GDP-fucose protein O-fucosyltransferase [Dillenia turbinata]|uniref:O-fucosyltransferase family protein n=1 Tax=Dillenia turbinata TaxID=194707 RepID=A0AAN8W5K9_9MAGN